MKTLPLPCIFPRRDIKNGRLHWRPWKLFLSEDVAVDPAYERSAVEHLVEDGHREVHAPRSGRRYRRFCLP